MCEHGDVEVVQTPDWLWGERSCPENGIAIDRCIANRLVEAWDGGLRTLGSCCGHGTSAPNVVLTQDAEQPALGRALLPDFTLFQWKLCDVTAAAGVEQP